MISIMIRASFEDVVIEKQRQALIPGFADVRRAALEAGALGCSIAGAGPTLFAWALESHAARVLAAMRAPLERRSIGLDAWVIDIELTRRSGPAVSAMRFASTRDPANAVGFCSRHAAGTRPGWRALCAGELAGMPSVPLSPRLELAVLGEKLLAPFLNGDALDAELGSHHA